MIRDLKKWWEGSTLDLSERELDMLVNALSALRISEEKVAQRRFEYSEIVGLRGKLHGELVLSRRGEG